jgi:hypothetical protein
MILVPTAQARNNWTSSDHAPGVTALKLLPSCAMISPWPLTGPFAQLAVRPKRRMDVGLFGDKLLLNLRQQPLRFGQRQTQVGHFAEIIRSADRHHLDTARLTITPCPNQT